MKDYKVTARYGSDTIKFGLPTGVKQETLNEAYRSARKEAIKAFGITEPLHHPDVRVTLTEYYED